LALKQALDIQAQSLTLISICW